MKVYMAYWRLFGWHYDSNADETRRCDYYQFMGIFSNYENAKNSFRGEYEYFLECGNNDSYENYVNDYGVIEEIAVDEVLHRDELRIYE